MEITEKVQKLIDLLRLSRRKLALAIVCDPSQMNKWWNTDPSKQTGYPTIDHVLRIARFFGIPMEYLADPEDEREPEELMRYRDVMRIIEEIGVEDAYSRLVISKKAVIPRVGQEAHDPPSPGPAVGSDVVADATRGAGRLVRPASDASRAENHSGRSDPSLP